MRVLFNFPPQPERSSIVNLIAGGSAKEALRRLFDWYGFTTPMLVMTPEEVLADPYYGAFLIVDMVVFEEREELMAKFPEQFQRFKQRLLERGMTWEQYMEIAPRRPDGSYLRRVGQVFPPTEEGEPILFVFSKNHYRDPRLVLHEFWEWAVLERRGPLHAWEVHYPALRVEAWTARFLAGTGYQ